MLSKSRFPIPGRFRISPLRTAFGKQIQYDHVTSMKRFYHLRMRITSPSHNHPFRSWIVLFHLFHNLFSRFLKINTFRTTSLMKWIHTIIICFSIQLIHFFIIDRCNLSKSGIRWLQESRTVISTPKSWILNIQL